MPGPSNVKKKRKSQGKSTPQSQRKNIIFSYKPWLDTASSSSSIDDDDNSRQSYSPSLSRPSLLLPRSSNEAHTKAPPEEGRTHGTFHTEHVVIEPKLSAAKTGLNPIPQAPFIYDPGNGPRVRDTRAFLESKYFAQPPALDIPLCAEFAKGEVLQMLMTVLPEETALILWYNKSRATSRICPACQRLYRLGDALASHFPDLDSSDVLSDSRPSPLLPREQELSGLCSSMCFIISAINYPNAIHSSWGRTEEEMDDEAWNELNSPPATNTGGDVSAALSMLMKMTRLHDLGLAQLCLGLDIEDIERLNMDDNEDDPESLAYN